MPEHYDRGSWYKEINERSDRLLKAESSAKTKPLHYNMPIPPLTFINKNNLGFNEGNVIKYVCRYKNKNGLEDLLKAREYLDQLIIQNGGF
jgi:hypothetical protein